jgi:hypothetical protein
VAQAHNNAYDCSGLDVVSCLHNVQHGKVAITIHFMGLIHHHDSLFLTKMCTAYMYICTSLILS